MRIMVAGSRRWTDEKAIIRAIFPWLIAAGGEVLHVVHGGAAGADTLAEALIRKALPMVNNLLRLSGEVVTVDFEVMRPQYRKGDTAWNKVAPLRRNDAMLDTNPDVVLAFLLGQPEHGGTQYTIKHAQQRGIPVWIINHPEVTSVQDDEGTGA